MSVSQSVSQSVCLGLSIGLSIGLSPRLGGGRYRAHLELGRPGRLGDLTCVSLAGGQRRAARRTADGARIMHSSYASYTLRVVCYINNNVLIKSVSPESIPTFTETMVLLVVARAGCAHERIII